MGDISVGETIDIYGSPFPSLLGRKCMASRFQAFVSLILHNDGEVPFLSIYSGPTMYLLDAPGCVPGTEGGCIVKDASMLCGCLGYAISAPAIGASFHLGWPVRLIAHVLCGTTMRLPTTRYESQCPRILESTVSIHLGNTSMWASGLLLHPSVVVTNAHALDSSTKHVYVMCHDGTKHDAYVRHRLDGILDLAFLHVPTLNSAMARILQSQPEVAGHVVVCGYPLWNPIHEACPSPKLTSGRVTGILRDTKNIAAFMTDAQVINGASGGPILQNDSLVGLVCSNARVVTRRGNQSTEVIHPTLNFCIPSHCIYTAYDILYAGGDGSMNTLREAFKEVTRVWENIHACNDTPVSKI